MKVFITACVRKEREVGGDFGECKRVEEGEG